MALYDSHSVQTHQLPSQSRRQYTRNWSTPCTNLIQQITRFHCTSISTIRVNVLYKSIKSPKKMVYWLPLFLQADLYQAKPTSFTGCWLISFFFWLVSRNTGRRSAVHTLTVHQTTKTNSNKSCSSNKICMMNFSVHNCLMYISLLCCELFLYTIFPAVNHN